MKKLFQAFFKTFFPGITPEQRDQCKEFLHGRDLRKSINKMIDRFVKDYAKARGDDGLPLSYDQCKQIAEGIFKNLKEMKFPNIK